MIEHSGRFTHVLRSDRFRRQCCFNLQMILCTSGVAVCYVVQVLVHALTQPRSQGPLLLCPSGERERTLGTRLALTVLLNFPGQVLVAQVQFIASGRLSKILLHKFVK